MSKPIFRIFLAALFFTIFFFFFYFRWYLYFRLSSLQLYQKELKNIYLQSPFFTMAGYFIIYVVVTSFSLPGAVIMTLVGGFLFGFLKGTILASFASSTGALIAFLLFRFLFSFKVKNYEKVISSYKARFGNQVKLILEKIKTEGAYYLFTLRLVPLVPFFIVNILMALTPIKARTFFWVSQLGMLPATLLYVNAGVQLSELETLKDVLSIPFILSFTVLGLFPIFVKRYFMREG